MAWINVIEEKEATGKLKDFYQEICKKRGKLSNIMKVHSLNPDAMKDHLNLYLTIMFDSSTLSRKQKELIGVVVSSINKCKYCVNHHAEALNHYLKNEKKIRKLIQDYNSVELSDKNKKMLNYVSKLTKKPHELTEEDINILKEYNFSDEDVLSINLITSYFNFVNRISLGLGVEFTEKESSGYIY